MELQQHDESRDVPRSESAPAAGQHGATESSPDDCASILSSFNAALDQLIGELLQTPRQGFSVFWNECDIQSRHQKILRDTLDPDVWEVHVGLRPGGAGFIPDLVVLRGPANPLTDRRTIPACYAVEYKYASHEPFWTNMFSGLSPARSGSGVPQGLQRQFKALDGAIASGSLFHGTVLFADGFDWKNGGTPAGAAATIQQRQQRFGWFKQPAARVRAEYVPVFFASDRLSYRNASP